MKVYKLVPRKEGSKATKFGITNSFHKNYKPFYYGNSLKDLEKKYGSINKRKYLWKKVA
jgi:hypothetical protein